MIPWRAVSESTFQVQQRPRQSGEVDGLAKCAWKFVSGRTRDSGSPSTVGEWQHVFVGRLAEIEDRSS